jgi:hypothetical protein
VTRGEAESLTQRIRNAAMNEGVPPLRLRNRVAFQRVLARLAVGDGWVLKGGFSLEMRLGLRARTTKDLDLLRRGPAPTTALDLQDALDEALETDLGDGFAFRVRAPKPMRLEDVEPSTWRVVVEVRYADTEFGVVTIDVVSAPTSPSTQDGVEPLRIQSGVVGDPFDMPALDLHRHAAEKFHAYARIYAHERPSSRVKDLVDLVLLDASGLLDDGRLGAALIAVFTERATALPDRLPYPPGEWAAPYAALAAAVGVSAVTVEVAGEAAQELYERARACGARAQEGITP